MARHRKTFWLLAALASPLATEPAHAYEEQASLDLALGYTRLIDAAPLPARGASFAVGASYGLTSALTLRGDASALWLAEDGRSRAAGRLRAEGLYLFDVLQVVPFAGLGLDLLAAEGRSGSARFRPGVHLVAGADYLLSRLWTIGLDLRGGIALDAGSGLGSIDVALRLSRMFETF